jgi:hypothetical protein
VITPPLYSLSNTHRTRYLLLRHAINKHTRFTSLPPQLQHAQPLPHAAYSSANCNRRIRPLTRTTAASHCSLLGALFLWCAFKPRIRDPVPVAAIAAFGAGPARTAEEAPSIFFALAARAARIVVGGLAVGHSGDGSLVVLVSLEEAETAALLSCWA